MLLKTSSLSIKDTFISKLKAKHEKEREKPAIVQEVIKEDSDENVAVNKEISTEDFAYNPKKKIHSDVSFKEGSSVQLQKETSKEKHKGLLFTKDIAEIPRYGSMTFMQKTGASTPRGSTSRRESSDEKGRRKGITFGATEKKKKK